MDGVHKIGVLMAKPVGDVMFILPALHAFRHTYPEAEIVLIGASWQADFLRGRPGPADRVILMGPYPGVSMEPDEPAGPRTAAFLGQLRGERFDLVAQMFGGGRYSNLLARESGARLTIGARTPDAIALDRWVPYAVPNNRRLAFLEVAALAGARPPVLQRELAVTEQDRAEATAVLASLSGKPLAVLQPGSNDVRRRWPTRNFAAVADGLVAAGAQVAINGTDSEAPLVRAVTSAMRGPAIDLSGQLSLGGLCAVLERAAVMVSNDTGPLHLALALGTPSVGIFWFTNLLEGTPLRQSLLRAALSVRVHCPVCGAENIRTRCPHNPSFVADVTAEQVTALAVSALRSA